MSTRCQIAIVDSSAAGSIYAPRIYKHSDGYPSGVLPTLIPFVEQFTSRRGDDPAYLLAQIVRAFAKAENGSEYDNGCLGWGIDCDWHGDLAYIYLVRDGKVETWKRDRDIASGEYDAAALPLDYSLYLPSPEECKDADEDEETISDLDPMTALLARVAALEAKMLS